MKSKNPFYLTRSEKFRAKWLKNFAEKIAAYAILFNIPSAWVDEIVASNTLIIDLTAFLEKLKKYTNQVVIIKNAMFNVNAVDLNLAYNLPPLTDIPTTTKTYYPNQLKRAIEVANMILNSPEMTDAIKADLQLNKPSETEAREASGAARQPVVTVRPIVKIKVSGDFINLKVLRGKPFRSMMAAVYVSRDDRNDFQFLKVTNTNTIEDRAVFPEGVELVTYTYKVQMMNGDLPVGEPSDPVTITVRKPLPDIA